MIKTKKSPETITKSIIGIVVSLKNENYDLTISNMIVQTENQYLNMKTVEVNKYLSEFCKENNFSLIDTCKADQTPAP